MKSRTPQSYLITGASSGLGAELVRQLAARGDRLALVARRRERLEEVARAAVQAAREAGVVQPFEPLVHPADVCDHAALREAIAAAWEALPGGIDVLVLNAGVGAAQRLDRFDGAIAARVIDVNLTANVHALAETMPRMLERGSGHIVAVSSLAAYRGLPGGAPYSASKAGLSTLLEGLRLELAPRGVQVTVVSPGFVKSEMTAKNRFPMPGILEAEDAVARMIRGMDRRRREVRFPLLWTLAMRLLRALPDPVFDWVGRRLGGKHDSRRPGGRRAKEAAAA